MHLNVRNLHRAGRAALLAFGLTPLASHAAHAVPAASCTVNDATINFGTVDVLTGAPANASATYTISCANSTKSTVTFCLDLGPGGSVAFPPRHLFSGSSSANVEFYSNPALTTVFGSYSGSYGAGHPGVTVTIQIDGKGSNKTGTGTAVVYGSFLGGQPGVPTATGGTLYADTFTQTATYYTGAATCGVTAGPTVTPAYVLTAVSTIQPQCNVTAGNLEFGSITQFDADTDAQSAISLICNESLPYTVSLSGGRSGSTDPTDLKMYSGSNTLTYGLYRDAARSQPWGSSAGSNTLAGVGTATTLQIPVYGRVFSNQRPVVGSYSDTIAVVVTY